MHYYISANLLYFIITLGKMGIVLLKLDIPLYLKRIRGTQCFNEQKKFLMQRIPYMLNFELGLFQLSAPRRDFPHTLPFWY